MQALAGGTGIGTLNDATAMQVVRNANAVPTLTMTYPLHGRNARDLQDDRVIKVDMGLKPEEQAQCFRIKNVDPTQSEIQVTAEHIIGDLANVKLSQQVTVANCTPSQAWGEITKAFAYDMPMITFYSDVLKVANIDWELDDTAVTQILLGDDQAGDKPTNTFETLYGVDFYCDNYKIQMLDNKEHNSGHIIKFRQNMLSFEMQRDTDSYYDGIMPFSKYTPNTTADKGAGEAYDGQGVVQYLGTGGAATYDSPFTGHNVVGHVQNGSFYHVKATQSENTVNDDKWYQLDDGSWIDEHFFTFDKSGAFVINKIDGQGHIAVNDDNDSDNQGIIVDFRGVGTITYAGKGKVAIWDTPFAGRHTTGQYLANGTNYQIFKKAVDYSGETWYNLGSDQWVPEAYFSVSKASDYATSPAQGILRIIKKPVSYTSPRMFQQTNWNPEIGSSWHITNTATGPDDSTLYQVSTYIWVKGDDETVEFKSQGTVAPNVEQADQAVAKQTGKVPIYAQPNGSAVTEHYMKVGDQCRIFAQADSNGKTWYEIGEGQWVDASYFSFAAADDVVPGTGAGADYSEAEVAEQTVTLDEKYILAPTAINTEHPKIQVVDLSSYNIEDQAKLREVAEAYIREYRIGIMPFTLTVNYAQLNDKYKFLTAIDLYDLVGVQVDELDFAQQAKVSSVTWDCLAHRYTTCTIGQMPITYDHALGQYVQDETTKSKAQAEARATHLFGRMHEIVKLQGDDQKAALQKLADNMNVSWKSNSDAIDKLQNMVNEINTTVDDVQSWISGGGSGVIKAVPNWQNPTMLVADTGNGGQMQFSGNGLQFVGTDGVDQTAIDSRGNVVAESITAGTIKGVTLEGVRVTGDSYLNSSGPEGNTVMSSENGFSYSPSNGHSMALGQSDTQPVQPVLRLGYASLTEDGLNDFLYWARKNIQGFRG